MPPSSEVHSSEKYHSRTNYAIRCNHTLTAAKTCKLLSNDLISSSGSVTKVHTLVVSSHLSFRSARAAVLIHAITERRHRRAGEHILLHAMKMLYALLVTPIRGLNVQKLRKLKRGE